tara:strand:- start:259 stop:699 length:441 start_codon:yes stop_codon:yes gene_type:complete
MKYVGSDLLDLAKSSASQAQGYASTLMSSSSFRDSQLEKAAYELVKIRGKTQRTLAASLVRYRNLPQSTQEDELPDNFDLLGSGALDVLIGMANDRVDEYEDINAVTDSVMSMGRREQRSVCQALLKGSQAPGMITHFFPLGVEVI